MCNTCNLPRFVIGVFGWNGNRASRTYYRIHDRARQYFAGRNVVASGSSLSDIEDICRVLNEEEARRCPPGYCCTCQRPL
jgi:hypothetical protein